ncbi:MCE family protein [Tomitella biformata]|uniref:MCE family protein n=1 Tax=Tomitella biformata TaxID=630403 RepID=UPI000466E0A8|nr:MlaD family protein [Tomitella biformata]
MKLGWYPVAKAVAFVAAGAACAVLVANTLTVPVRGATDGYTVEFTDVEGLGAGNAVTLAGVRVGRVDSIAFADAGGGTSKAVVGIEVESAHALAATATATVRYGDMLGARYIALEQPAGWTGAAGPELEPGGTIPLSRTTPPVDLTALMNGFKPLFQALDPDQVNTLARAFVDTFNGQGQAVNDLLVQIGDVSSGLADRQEVVRQLVENMGALLASVDARAPQLEELVVGLGQLTDSVAGDSDRLVSLLDQGNTAVATLAGAMERSNGDLSRSITELTTMTDVWVSQTEQFTGFLGRMPGFANAINRISGYGGFVSLYLCNMTLKAGDLEANIFGATHSPTCR